jgi:hypothetical protein
MSWNSSKLSAALPALMAVTVIAGTVALTPESVTIERLPLPPTAPSSAVGSCTAEINPNGTGCIGAGTSIDGARSFTPDGNHVYVSMRFEGAPATGPASVYTGGQLILVKTDGTTFPNGDAWKCVTCGVPAENQQLASLTTLITADDNTYPEAFADGKRVKTGRRILDCSPYNITDAQCTPEVTYIYPIVSPFPTYRIMREIRLHPDNVHLGWNQLILGQNNTAATQFAAFGRLVFLPPAPPTNVPRYELTNVTLLQSPELGKSGRFFSVGAPGELILEPPTGVIGEFRGFTPDGKSTIGMGTQDSFNYDIFATSLETGVSTRLTRDPAYTDPANISPDGKSMVILDGRVTDRTGYNGAPPAGSEGRLYFASAGIGVPPLIDLAIAEAVGNLYTGSRGSFLQPVLIDLETPLDVNNPNIHDGQQLNLDFDYPVAGCGDISDPLWLAGADPAWSPDGTTVVYYQRRFGCDPSKAVLCLNQEPGGRNARLMIARLDDREPTEPLPQPEPVSDVVPWGIPYVFNQTLPPHQPVIPDGTYTLTGLSGSAEVIIGTGPSRFRAGDLEVVSVEVTYFNYSSDGVNFINGTESGVRGVNTSNQRTLTWHADLEFSGLHTGSRKSSEPGGFVVTATSLAGNPVLSGTLITTLDGEVYSSETIQ